MEKFKEIDGYSGLYEVSNTGKVRSIKRDIIMKPSIKYGNTTNYYSFILSNHGIKKFQAHRLVASAFIDNPEGKPFINHIDNDGTNNNVSNLEWCTHSENMIHASKRGRIPEGTNNLLKSASRLNAISREKYENIFGNRLIDISVHSYRKIITFRCIDCSKIFRSRTDSQVIRRGGQCRRCFLNSKEEDIVRSEWKHSAVHKRTYSQVTRAVEHKG